VGRADGVHRPVIALAVCDKCSDADDRVVDVLRELVADRLADLYVGLADEIVSGREPG
jgi:anti-sigma factor ChrR (cupin superfamily)